METFFVFFPRYGKVWRDFSTLWKSFWRFFHAMENSEALGVEAGVRRYPLRHFDDVGPEGGEGGAGVQLAIEGLSDE